MKIIPSLIANSQQELDTRLKKILPLKPEWVQLDIMDGSFVSQFSLDFDFELPKKIKYEAHLMVRNPEPWFAHAHKKINSVIVHYESQVHLAEFIAQAKGNKRKIGIALKPETDVDNILPYLHWIDKVLVMTVNPGKYGAPFLPKTIEKIKQLAKDKHKITIQVDGGINPKTIAQCANAGATEFIVGSYLQKSSDVKKSYRELVKATHD
jgi:ribulose-phosphate 3-epimerase